MRSKTAMGFNGFFVFAAFVSVTLGRTVIFTKPCLDSPSEQPFKILRDIKWDIDCARQCKRENDCLFMAFNSSDDQCILFNSNISISQSGCTEGVLQLYQMHEELVCEHGYKTSEGICNCTDSYVGRRCERIMEDCSEAYSSGFYDGLHDEFWIKPRLSATPFQVHCFIVDGGKTFFQKNSNWDGPLESFNRTWQEYVDGFGDFNRSHWLGLQKIYEITNSRNYNLLINIHARPLWNNKTIIYHNFKISDAASGFKLMIDTSEPMNPWPLDDCLSTLNNTQFSTPDRPAPSCVAYVQSGWWFDNSCSGCDANGDIDQERTTKGAFWDAGFQNDTVIYTEMVLVAA